MEDNSQENKNSTKSKEQNHEEDIKEDVSLISLDNMNDKNLKRKKIPDSMNNPNGVMGKNLKIFNKNDNVNDVCHTCDQCFDSKKMITCSSCKFKKCQECAVKEDRYDETGVDGMKYVCASCVEYQKPRKKIREQSSERSFIGNKRDKREYLEKNSSMDKSPSLNVNDSKDDGFNFSSQMEEWKSPVLDLDLLHKVVSPPSELYQSDDNMKTRKIGKVMRKSNRVQKKVKNNLFQFINCHQCKKIDNSNNMTICSNGACRESYCYICIKKYFPKNPEGYIQFKESDKSNWLCYICTASCLCKNCGFRQYSRNIKKKEKSIVKNNNSIITIPNHLNNNIDNSNIVKIDNYIIYEEKGPEDESEIDNMEMEEQSNVEDKQYKTKNSENLTINEQKSSLYIKNVEIYSKKATKVVNKLCIICKNSNFMNYEILKFKCFEEFLHYVKYNCEHKFTQFNQDSPAFKKNKEIFQEFFTNYENYQKSEYQFRSGKHICKTCFISNLNIDNGFINLCKALKIPYSTLIMKGGMKFDLEPETKTDQTPKNAVKVENHDNFLLEQLSDSKKVFNQMTTNKKKYDDIKIHTVEEVKTNLPTQLKSSAPVKEINEKTISKIEESDNIDKAEKAEKADNFNKLFDLISPKTDSSKNIQLIKSMENNSFIKNIQNPIHLQQITKMNQNMSNVNSGLFKLVDSIAQFNQKNLLNNNPVINKNLNQILNVSQNPDLMNSENPGQTIRNEENKEIQNNNDNDQVQVESNDKDNVNVCNIIMNLDQKQNIINNHQITALIEDLKKQIFSIQFHSLIQRNFISYIFKNLEIFIDQITNNQVMNELVVNNLVKYIPKTANVTISQENLNNINEQISILRKINILGSNVTTSLNSNFEEIKNSGYKLITKPENGFPQINNNNGIFNPMELMKMTPNIFQNKPPNSMPIPNMSNLPNLEMLKQNQNPQPGQIPSLFEINKQKINGMMMNNQGPSQDNNNPNQNINSLLFGLNSMNNPLNPSLMGVNPGFNMNTIGFPQMSHFPIPPQMNLGGYINQNNMNIPHFMQNISPNNFPMNKNNLVGNFNPAMSLNNAFPQSMGMNPSFNQSQNHQSISQETHNINPNATALNNSNNMFNENNLIHQMTNNQNQNNQIKHFSSVNNQGSPKNSQMLNNKSNDPQKYNMYAQNNEMNNKYILFSNPNNFNYESMNNMSMIPNNNMDIINNYLLNYPGNNADSSNLLHAENMNMNSQNLNVPDSNFNNNPSKDGFKLDNQNKN